MRAVKAQDSERTIEAWYSCAGTTVQDARRYSAREQDAREQAYDEALDAVEEDIQRASTPLDRIIIARKNCGVFRPVLGQSFES